MFLVETLELRGWGADPRATQRSPSEKMARPGLLSWPLVRGAERSLGGGGDPWGQIRPVLWSPRALPTAEQGEPTAHKQGAELGTEPCSHLPARDVSWSQGSSEPQKTDSPHPCVARSGF